MIDSKQKYAPSNPAETKTIYSENLYEEIDEKSYARLSHAHFENYSNLEKNKLNEKKTSEFDALNKIKKNATKTTLDSNNQQNKFLSFFKSITTNRKKMAIFLAILIAIFLVLILTIVLIVLGVASICFKIKT